MKYLLFIIFIIYCSSGYANERPLLKAAFQIELLIDINTQREYCAYSTEKRVAYERFQENKVKILPYQRKPFDYNQEVEFNKKKEIEDKLLYDPNDYPEQEAAFKLGVIYAGLPCETSQFNQALKYFSLSGRKPEAQFGTGVILYKQGKELKRAYDLFLIASKRGVAKASYNVAVMLWKQNPVKFQKKIKFYLEKAGDGGYRRAYSDLSVLLIAETQNDAAADADIMKKAYDFANKAADAKDLYGLYNRAVLQLYQGCSKESASSIVDDLYESARRKFIPAIKLLKSLRQQPCTNSASTEAFAKLQKIYDSFMPSISPPPVKNISPQTQNSLEKRMSYLVTQEINIYNRRFEFGYELSRQIF